MRNKQYKFKTQNLFLSCFLFVMLSCFSQESNKDLNVVIVTSFNGELIEKDKWFLTKMKDSIQLSKLKFYLTNFAIESKNKEKDSIPKSNFLIDAFKEETAIITLTNINYKTDDELILNIGVNEIMNTSGANSGHLDPSKGMFWSWQSGYVNFKIEGVSPSCKTRKNKFQFHIGGYQKPFETIRSLGFKLDAVKNNTLQINLDISQFFDDIDLSSQNQIMIPGKEASAIADKLPKLFLLHD